MEVLKNCGRIIAFLQHSINISGVDVTYEKIHSSPALDSMNVAAIQMDHDHALADQSNRLSRTLPNFASKSDRIHCGPHAHTSAHSADRDYRGESLGSNYILHGSLYSTRAFE
mmetsp:Transcript_39953/g.83081  ORF Transcript_39953/g.83081 Transcript_39953/m.83081 type:complete len:113 (+) Transcript_39953:354-692(+)